MPALHETVRHVTRLMRSYPETSIYDLPQKDRVLRRRRAKNKVARQSRKVNR